VATAMFIVGAALLLLLGRYPVFRSDGSVTQ
jgi:hypothetical protein